jgi:phosphonate transport system substrate-binding protein
MPDSDPVTLAVVSSAPTASRDLDALAEALSLAASRPVRPLLLSSYAELEPAVASGRADLVWAPPLVAAGLEAREIAAIDLCCTRGGGRIDYHAALFTRHASRIETLADLAGAHVAWVDENSSAGYLFPRLHLRAQGLDPEALFGEQSFLGTHASVAMAVLAGEADAGATYLSLAPGTEKPISAGWLEAGAGINGAYILAVAGPIPNDVIVSSRRLPGDLRAALVAAMAALPASSPDAVGRLFGADGFAPPSPTHFDALRAQVKASGPR